MKNIYVSPFGNDANHGTLLKPLKSFQQAVNNLVSLRKDDPLSPVTVFFRGGTYQITYPINIPASASGTKNVPIVLKAYQHEKPIFTGGINLIHWTKLTDKKVLQRIPHYSRNKIWVTDLKKMGIVDYGSLIEAGKRAELYCNGNIQILSRWPNTVFTYIEKTIDKTHFSSEEKGHFTYSQPRINNWINESQPCVEGYWKYDWSDQHQEVEKIDTLSKTITLRKPIEYTDGARFYGFNLLCELDAPREWYLDRTDGLLYWYPPRGILPNNANVILSKSNAQYLVELQGCSNILISGLNFCYSRGSGLLLRNTESCTIELSTISNLGKNGIDILQGHNATISRCTLRVLGCLGLNVAGGDRQTLTYGNHKIVNNIIEYYSLFKRTYQPAICLAGCGDFVSHNVISHSPSSAIRLVGNDFTIEYNDISHVVEESDDQGGIDIWRDPSYRGIIIRNNRWSDIVGGTKVGVAAIRLDDLISGVEISSNIFIRCGSKIFGAIQINGGKDNVVNNNIFINCKTAISFSPWGQIRYLKALNSESIKKLIYKNVNINSNLYLNHYPKVSNISNGADINIIKNNLLIGCDNSFLRKNDKVDDKNNIILQKETLNENQYCSKEFLKKYNLNAIPIKNIGLERNIRQ